MRREILRSLLHPPLISDVEGIITLERRYSIREGLRWTHPTEIDVKRIFVKASLSTPASRHSSTPAPTSSS